jgi:hypothetical protein
MPNPWDSLDLIECNLMKIATLRVGEKIGAPDSAGVFRIFTSDSGRSNADSITETAPILKRLFKRAILVSICDEVKPVGKVRSLLQAVVSIGLPNLRATYKRKLFQSKANQRNAVDDLVGVIQSEAPQIQQWLQKRASDSFDEVRCRYKLGYKSSNKRYEVMPAGKYRADDKGFQDREAQRKKATKALGKYREALGDVRLAQDMGASKVDQALSEREAVLDRFVASELGVGKTYRGLDAKEFEDLYTKVKLKDQPLADEFLKFSRQHLELGRVRKAVNRAPPDPWKAEAGNCAELAYLALLDLKRCHAPFICRASLSTAPGQVVDGRQGDHVFTIVGLRLTDRPSFERPKTEVFITPRERVHLRSAWVVDPWVNLCCRISEYPSRFTERMQEWSAKGKRVGLGHDWIDPDPLKNSWYARTVAELDWKISEYLTYDPLVLEAEERAESRMQGRGFQV